MIIHGNAVLNSYFFICAHRVLPGSINAGVPPEPTGR